MRAASATRRPSSSPARQRSRLLLGSSADPTRPTRDQPAATTLSSQPRMAANPVRAELGTAGSAKLTGAGGSHVLNPEDCLPKRRCSHMEVTAPTLISREKPGPPQTAAIHARPHPCRDLKETITAGGEWRLWRRRFKCSNPSSRLSKHGRPSATPLARDLEAPDPLPDVRGRIGRLRNFAALPRCCLRGLPSP